MQTLGVWLVIVGAILIMLGQTRPTVSYTTKPMPEVPADKAHRTAKLVFRINEAERREREALAALEDMEEQHEEFEEDAKAYVDALARAYTAARAVGCRDACDLIEGVLDDMDPAWRVYA